MGLLRKIRNRFFPPGWNTVNRYHEETYSTLIELKKTIEKESFVVNSSLQDLYKENAELKEFLFKIKCAIEEKSEDERCELDSIKKSIRDNCDENNTNNKFITKELQRFRKKFKTYYWNNGYERKAIRNNYGFVSEDDSFREKYFALIQGLDEESILAINKILWRQEQYLTHDEAQLDLFTQREQNELYIIDEIFQKNILKIADDLYAYGHYLLPIKRFDPIVFYYKYCLEEVNLGYIKGKTIIDAGAFIGDTALIFSELEPESIVAFEPIQGNYELCKKTIEINNLTNITLEKIALGSKKGDKTMYSAWAGSTIYPRDEDIDSYTGTDIVSVITLDEYVYKNNLKVGLIKMDIEGSESDCLIGAKRVITDQRPIMLICIYHNKNDFFDIKPMLESWNLNYRFKVRKPTVNNSTYETLLIAEPYEKHRG